MTSLRERLRAVSQRLTGSRWLRDTIWPGGVYVAGGMPPDRFAAAVTRIVDEFTPKALAILQSPACRDRLIGCGLLTTDEARGLGVMGLPRRVAGYMERDWRLRHPFGPYEREDIREEIRATVAEGQPRSEDGQLRPRGAALRPRDLTGDNLAKMALRVAEVETSARIIERLAAELDGTAGSGAAGLQDLPGKTDRHSLADDDAYELGFGAVEGARGPVGCCVMRGPGRLLYRCKPFGASPGLLRAFSAAAAVRSGPNQTLLGDILADAPLDNVAMNASLAECAG
jgi:Ni,Fe-hydrogenase III large subunit